MPTRVVVRHLPPLLPTEVLLRILAPFRADFTDFYHIVGDPTLGKFCFGRAYMVFANDAAMFRFARAFDGHMFRNAMGVEHRALVERAPLLASAARRPAKARVDKLSGTLDQDAAFVKFAEELANPSPAPAPATLAPVTTPSGDSSGDGASAKTKAQTPLVLFLQARYRGATRSAGPPSASKPVIVRKWVCPSSSCQSGSVNEMSASVCGLCGCAKPKGGAKVLRIDATTGVTQPSKVFGDE